MKLVSWNVNGYRSVFKKGLLDFVRAEDPDFLCVQETKAGEEILRQADLALPDRELFCSSALKKGYSGVATWVHRRVLQSAPKVELGIGNKAFDDEGRFVILRCKDFDLYNIYFPSGTTGDLRQKFKYRFLDEVESYLAKLPKKSRDRAVVCGDFNICHREIDIHHPETATKLEMSGFLPDERAWMERLVAHGFVDTFRHVHGEARHHYSWWSFRAGSRGKNLGWRIDYFFVAKALQSKISNACLLPKVMGSDHCPVILELAF